jgi:hypothetical protein
VQLDFNYATETTGHAEVALKSDITIKVAVREEVIQIQLDKAVHLSDISKSAKRISRLFTE